MLNVVNADCHILAPYAECLYAECRYAECRGAIETPSYKLFEAVINFVT
jgi:hypothetical protein